MAHLAVLLALTTIELTLNFSDLDFELLPLRYETIKAMSGSRIARISPIKIKYIG
jgi:hypothetical protein